MKIRSGIVFLAALSCLSAFSQRSLGDSGHTFTTFSTGSITGGGAAYTRSLDVSGLAGSDFLFVYISADYVPGASPNNAYSSTMFMELNNGAGTAYWPASKATTGVLAAAGSTSLEWKGLMKIPYPGGGNLTLKFQDSFTDGSGPYTSSLNNVVVKIYPATVPAKTFTTFSTGSITGGGAAYTRSLDVSGLAGSDFLFVYISADYVPGASPNNAYSSTMFMELNNGAGTAYWPASKATTGVLAAAGSTSLEWKGLMKIPYPGGGNLTLKFQDSFTDGSGPYTSSLNNVVVKIYPATVPAKTFTTFSTGSITGGGAAYTRSLDVSGLAGSDFLFVYISADYVPGASPNNAYSSTMFMELNNGAGTAYWPASSATTGVLAAAGSTSLEWKGLMKIPYPGGGNLTLKFQDSFTDGSGPYTSSLNNVTVTIYSAPVALAIPTATAATNVQTNSFSAKWNAVTGATGYRLDVATDSSFNTFVTGWQNVDVANVTTYSVNSNLTPNTTYYYRVRAYNAGVTTGNSNTITVTTSTAAPTATTDAASGTSSTGTTLNGTINANYASTTVTFQYGLTTGYGSTVTAVQSPVTGSSNTSVSKAITGLSANTTYHFRVVGVNGGGTTNGSDLTFTTSTSAPAATTDAASGTGSTGTTLNGTVNANNESTTVTFEYGLTTGYGTTVTATQSPVTGTSNTAVSKAITGLTPNSTYHYRVIAQNATGTTNGLDQTFTTSATAPAVTTGAASGTASTTATLNGTVNPNNASTAVTFQYGLTTGYGSTATATPSTVTGTSNTAVGASISGLSPGTTYHFRAVGVDSGGTTNGDDQTLTTTAVAPTVSTTAASSITATGASTGGDVTATGGSAITARGVCWGTSANPSLSDNFTSNGAAAGSFTSTLSGLDPNTLYHIRPYATNGVGTSYGGDLTFTTLTTNPTVASPSSTVTGANLATLGGTISALGGAAVTERGIYWSTTDGFTPPGQGTKVSEAGSWNTTGAFTLSVSGLPAATPIYYKAFATNIAGTGWSAQGTFTTDKADQTITFDPPAAATYGDATFDLTATSTSGLTVGFTSSDTTVATISGTTVTIVGAGSTTITAAQAGNATYNPATDVPQTLTVDKKTLTATADDATRDYGQANPAFTVSYTGFVGSESAADLATPPAATSAANAASPAGTYNIIPAGGLDNNYAFTYQNGTLTVAAVDPTVSNPSGTLQTTSSAALGGMISSTGGLHITERGVYWSTTDGFTPPAQGAKVSEAGDWNSTGTFTVNVTGLPVGSTVYFRAFAKSTAGTGYSGQGSVTTEKNNQTITFDTLADKTSGDPAFDLVASASSGLAVSFTSSNPNVATILGSTVTIVAAGTTTITASQAGNGTCNPAPDVQRTLTVNAAPDSTPTITPTPAAVVTDPDGKATIADQTLTAEVSGFDPNLPVTLTADRSGTTTLQVGPPQQAVFATTLTGITAGTAVTVSVDQSTHQNTLEIIQPSGRVVRVILVQFPEGANVGLNLANTRQILGSVTNQTGRSLDVDIQTQDSGGDIASAVTYHPPTSNGTAKTVYLAPGGSITIQAAGVSQNGLFNLAVGYSGVPLGQTAESALRLMKVVPGRPLEAIGPNDRGNTTPTATLGDYGIDTPAKKVWANVDSLGTFAIGVPKEPVEVVKTTVTSYGCMPFAGLVLTLLYLSFVGVGGKSGKIE